MKNNRQYFVPDMASRLISFCVKWRARLPGWRLETMAQLVRAETEGVHIIEQVLSQVGGTDVRRLLEKHLDDEKRHVQVFTERYETLLYKAGKLPEKLSKEQQSGSIFSLLPLIAYLEIQELRAIHVLETYVKLYEGDDETVDAIRRNLRDEKFHATWTHQQMERWAAEGRSLEVNQARKMAQEIDSQAFRKQMIAFLKALPTLLKKRVWPPIFSCTPSPL